MAEFDSRVFLNVPFDNRYRKLLHALVFVIHDCGLEARCALEEDDGGRVRLDKIYRIIAECRYGIHDLSRTALDRTHRLPRFNMPFELGIFLGVQRYGGPHQRTKSCVILDKTPYRYQVFCSDIAGQDIRSHGNQVESVIQGVRNWLRASLPRSIRVKSATSLMNRYTDFRRQLPVATRYEGFSVAELTFLDYRTFVDVWVNENPD